MLWINFFQFSLLSIFWHSQKRLTYRQLSRCCRTRSSPRTSSESGRRPMYPWCRRSVLNRTSRRQQRPWKLQHHSVLLQWSRPVYKDSTAFTVSGLRGLHTHILLIDTQTAVFSWCYCSISADFTYYSSIWINDEGFCWGVFSKWRWSRLYMISRSH